MRTPDQVRWDFVQDWLRKANSDLKAARILTEEDLDDYEVAAFHAQQAAEKLIKAYLVRHQLEFAKTHEIKTLRKLVAARSVRPPSAGRSRGPLKIGASAPDAGDHE